MIRTDIYDVEKISRGPLDVYKIYERFQAAMYLVCGRERACLIDTAFGLCDLAELTASLTPLPVTVINTHAHEDHVLGNCHFRKAMMHPADRPMYRKIAEGYAEMLSQPWVRREYGAFLEGVDPAAVRFPEAEDLLDGDLVDLGGKVLRVAELPGHTPGSILVLDPDEGLCFSGDAIIEHLWLFLEESLPAETYLRALRRASGILREAGIRRIYNGHYAWKPLTPADTEVMLAGMEAVCAGKAQGRPFENAEGAGIEYAFGDWSVLCRREAGPPPNLHE